MNWTFFKKKTKREPRRVYVPAGYKRRLLLAWDVYMSAPDRRDNLAHYEFWVLAEQACPEVREGSNWKPVCKNGTKPYFLEILK